MAFLSKPDRKVSAPRLPKRPPKPTLAQEFDKLLEGEVLGPHPGLVECEVRLHFRVPKDSQRTARRVPKWVVKVLLPTLGKVREAESVVEAALVEWVEGRIVKTPGGIYRACPVCERRGKLGRKRKEVPSDS